MQESWELVEHLNISGRKLSKSHRRIAEYLTEHYDKAVFMTASQLGHGDGAIVRNIILFSVLIYELVGPALTKIALTKAGGSIDALAGATITSRAVTNATAASIEAVGMLG